MPPEITFNKGLPPRKLRFIRRSRAHTSRHLSAVHLKPRFVSDLPFGKPYLRLWVGKIEIKAVPSSPHQHHFSLASYTSQRHQNLWGNAPRRFQFQLSHGPTPLVRLGSPIIWGPLLAHWIPPLISKVPPAITTMEHSTSLSGGRKLGLVRIFYIDISLHPLTTDRCLRKERRSVSRRLLDRNATPISYGGGVAQQVRDLYSLGNSVGSYTNLAYPTNVSDLSDQLTLTGRQIHGGGFANIHQATWHRGEENIKVAVKVLRASQGNQEEIDLARKRFCREISIWSGLEHDNILRLYGTACGPEFGPSGMYGMVCMWAENGDLCHYLDKNKSLPLSLCFKLLNQIASALRYLHNNSVVHGDLTGRNILVDDEGNVLLCDFGLSLILGDENNPLYQTSSKPKFNTPWSAPEIVLPTGNTNPRPTKFTDIYSFGSVMLQILSGRVPYDGKFYSVIIIYLYREAHHPPRPTQAALVSDDLWKFMNRCWKLVPEERLSIDEVCEFLCQYVI